MSTHMTHMVHTVCCLILHTARKTVSSSKKLAFVALMKDSSITACEAVARLQQLAQLRLRYS